MKRRAFTLTELLVVVAIMGVLMIMTIPAFNGIMKGAKMRSAVTQVRTTLSLARQWAITHSEDTYVVFPTNTGSMAFRAFGVFTHGNGYVKEWSYLPDGVFVDPKITDGSFVNVLSGNPDTIYSVGFPGPGTNQPTPCVAFRPDGRLKQNGGTRILVGLSEGTVDTNTFATTTYPGKLAFGIRCYPLTGQFKVKELP